MYFKKFDLKEWLTACFIMLLTYLALGYFVKDKIAIEPSSIAILFLLSFLYVFLITGIKTFKKPVNKLVPISIVCFLILLFFLQTSGVITRLFVYKENSRLVPKEQSHALVKGTATGANQTESNNVNNLQASTTNHQNEQGLTSKSGVDLHNPVAAHPEISIEKKDQIDKFFLDVFTSIRAKNWDKLIEQARQPDVEELQSEAILTFALAQAVANGAPLDVLLKLLNDGAQFTPETLFATVMRQDTQIIKTFVGYGLDLHMRDAENRTALYYNLFNLQKRDMFDYLISQNVSTRIANPQHDLISRVLASCNSTTNAKYFMERILSSGEKIQPHHKKSFTAQVLNSSLCVNSIAPYFSKR